MVVQHLRGLGACLTLAAMALALAAGCGDGEEAATSPAETPTVEPADGTPVVSGASVIDAVVTYVTETGLDGEIMEAAAPINCNAFLDPAADPSLVEEATGKVCINFGNSAFTETEGVMEVAIVGGEGTWELTLELQRAAWVVTGAKAKGE